MKDKKSTKKPDLHEDLKGFDIKINEFGQIESNYDVRKLNQFLNENVEDKKLANRKQEEE